MGPQELIARAPGRLRPPGARTVAVDVVDSDYADPPSVHLRDTLQVLCKYRWLAATCFGATLALAVLATVLTTRTYTATTRLQVARHSPIQLQLDENVLRVDGDERSVNGASSFLATQVAILRSRDLAERVIREHGLEERDVFGSPTGRDGVLAVGGRLLNLLRPRGWTGATETGPAEPRLGSAPVGPGVIEAYLGALQVSEVRGTDLVDLTFTTPSPELSAFLAAAHTQAYLAANDEARLATNVTAKAFLGEQLREAREKLDRAEAALSGFAAEHPQIAVDTEHRIASERLRGLTEELGKVQAMRLALGSRGEFLASRGDAPLSYFLEKPGVQKVRLAILDLEAQEAAVSDRLGRNHPDMIVLRQQKAALARQLEGELARELAAVRARHEALALRERRLADTLAAEEQDAIRVQALGSRYALLQRDVETARSLRDSLLKQQMETAVNSELAASNIRVVDRAEVPLGAAKPNVPLNLAIGVVLGLFVAVGATLLTEYFDSSVKSRDDVESLLQMPTLGTIPQLSERGRAAADAGGGRASDLVVHRAPRSLVAEAFRALRTAVLFSAPGSAPRVVVLTSAGAGEGKTLSSLNLATTLAAAGSTVLLIDADLRRPAVHRAFGLANADGLSRYLAGQTRFDAVTHASEVPNLAVVPAGPTPPNPAELVGSERMRELLEQLRAHYDFVIVDSPPTLPVTDAVLLARQADGVVLVVKAHDTPRELVRRARDQLALAGAHLLGAVVNNASASWGGYGHYDRYFGGYYGAGRADAEA